MARDLLFVKTGNIVEIDTIKGSGKTRVDCILARDSHLWTWSLSSPIRETMQRWAVIGDQRLYYLPSSFIALTLLLTKVLSGNGSLIKHRSQQLIFIWGHSLWKTQSWTVCSIRLGHVHLLYEYLIKRYSKEYEANESHLEMYESIFQTNMLKKHQWYYFVRKNQHSWPLAFFANECSVNWKWVEIINYYVLSLVWGWYYSLARRHVHITYVVIERAS